MRKAPLVVASLSLLFATGVFSVEPNLVSGYSLATINPFNPPATSLLTHENGGDWRLKGIMFAGRASQADLDGRVIGIGETIRGYTVVAIEPRKVILRKGGVIEVVSLDDDDEDHGDG